MAGDPTNAPPSSASPSKRRKILFPKLDSGQHEERPRSTCELDPESSPAEDDGSGSPCCGICLSDRGKSVQGRIDSCDHYFCFVCIMEWAKVESLCPMCKRRFATIYRPPKPGVFLTERVVNVPQRDQVYHLFGNATTTRFDPCVEVRCTICNSMADESLLLLCDLCDLAAHTYCVGLGYTVPEGDWFCHDCEISRAEHQKAETDTETSQPGEHVSIIDIVHDPNDFGRVRKVSRISFTTQLSHRVSLGSGSSSGHEETVPATVTDSNPVVYEINESCARTLNQCPNVRSRIQVLRENWDSLRSGSLRFSSASRESSKGQVKRHDDTRNECPSASANTRFTNGMRESTGEKGDPYDIDKAWKMMDIAKSAKRNLESARSAYQVSKMLLGKGTVSGQPSNIRAKQPWISERQQPGTQNQDNGMAKGKSIWHVHRKQIDKQNPQKSGKRKVSENSSGEYNNSPSSSRSPIYHDLLAHERLESQEGARNAISPVKIKRGASSSEADVQRWSYSSPGSLTPAGSTHQDSSDSSRSGSELAASYSSPVSIPKGMLSLQNRYTERTDKKSEGAKTEIQTLVKFNLKLLTKHNKPGVDTFKRIARTSTHTIMVACGMEVPRPGIRLTSTPTCHHDSKTQQLLRSPLMPSLCQECFPAFVKHVVQDVMNERLH